MAFPPNSCWKPMGKARRSACGSGALHARPLSPPLRGGGGRDLGGIGEEENGKRRGIKLPPRLLGEEENGKRRGIKLPPRLPRHQWRRRRILPRRARQLRRRLLDRPRQSARARGPRLGRANARACPRRRSAARRVERAPASWTLATVRRSTGGWTHRHRHPLPPRHRGRRRPLRRQRLRRQRLRR